MTDATIETLPANAIDPDQAPEAPSPSPAREFFMRCTENRAADDYDGGIVLFQAISGQHSDDIVDGRLVLSAKHDSFLMTYPWKTRAAKQERFFRVRLEEVDASEVPPARVETVR